MQPKSSRLDDGKDVEKAEISSGLESQQGGYFEFVAKYKRALYSSKGALEPLAQWTRNHCSNWNPLRGKKSRIQIRKLEDCPMGYPRVAAFMDSDENFMLYRRFGFLYSRILLNKQDELREIEETLDQMDKNDSATSKDSALCLQWRVKDASRKDIEPKQSRQGLLRTSEEKLNQYSHLLLQAQQLVSMNKPASRDYESLLNFMENGYEHNGESIRPLLKKDSKFIYLKEDLVTLRPGRESAWLDASIERLLRMANSSPIRYLFCSKETREKTTNPNLHYFTKERVNRFVTLIISFIILLLLVAPIYGLYRTSNGPNESNTNAKCIGILLVATLVFSAVLSLFTKAKRHEILGASAAYCAVLVVFFGNVGGRGSVIP